MRLRHWVYNNLARFHLMRMHAEDTTHASGLALAAHLRFAFDAAGLSSPHGQTNAKPGPKTWRSPEGAAGR
jgi:DUF1365 family protein